MTNLLFSAIFFTLSASLFAGPVKIFSMNLHCGLGDWSGRMDQVVEEILKQNPDVIGLQEVCYNEQMNMATYILEKLADGGYDVQDSRTIDTHKSFMKYEEQLLLISNRKPEAAVKGMLPSMKFFENGYLAAKFSGVWFVTTHLHFALPQIRKTQYKTLNKICKGERVILFGDMNSNPTDGETRPFQELGWTALYGGATYPSEKPSKTFDGFWFSPGLQERLETPSFELLFKGSKNPPSDHLGMTLSFKL